MDQNRQTIKNFIFNSLSLIVSIALGLFYTPYLVRSLGIIAYGIVPLALIINQYVNVITGSLTGSLTRFYSVAFQQKNFSDASKYLSSSFIAITLIVIALAPLFVLIILKIDTLFNIPAMHVREAQLLFSFTIMSFILSLYSSLFNITLYCLNRLDLMNVIKIVRILFKVMFTILFFEFLRKGIPFIGYANFFSEFFVISISFYYFLKTTDSQIKISLRFYEKTALVSILSMTIWVIIHQLGDTGLYRIDNVLVNHFWSTRESGILGALSEFGTYVMTVVSVISTLFGPLILIAYSNEDHNAVKKLTTDNSLLVGIATSLLVGLLIGFAKPIIGLWLGEEYVAYSNWFVMKQITLPFYAAAGVYAFVNRAWNRVIFPAVGTLIIGAVNLLLSCLICMRSNGAEVFILTILITASIFIVLQSYGLNAFCFYRLYPEIGLKTPALIFLKILLGLIMTIAISKGYSSMLKVTSLIQLAMGIAIVSVTFIIVGFVVFLNHSQKQLILSYILKNNLFYRN
jgi:membrane protein EpsK